MEPSLHPVITKSHVDLESNSLAQQYHNKLTEINQAKDGFGSRQHGVKIAVKVGVIVSTLIHWTPVDTIQYVTGGILFAIPAEQWLKSHRKIWCQLLGKYLQG